jgi:ABC-type iron transport system FetAB permease component
MLSGSAISGMIISISYILTELQYVIPLLILLAIFTSIRENRDKVEIYLAFGASRMEACRPIAKAALRVALTPVINKMRCSITPSAITSC